jgi:nucleoside-diphosphate-sugar epimerase
MVFPSTGYVYASDSPRPLLETSPVRVSNMYTATKLAAESLVIGHARANRYNAIVVRLSNIYGPDSSKETVIGKIITQARSGQPIAVNEESPVRDFIFIDDVIEGVFRLIENLIQSSGQTVNLSTGTGTSICQIINLVSKIMNQKESASSNLSSSGNPGGSSIVLANQLLQSLTGWKPSISLAEGLMLSISN